MAKGLNFTDFGSSNTKLQMKAGAHKRAAGPYTVAAPRWPGPSPSSPGTVRCLLSQHHLPSTSYPPPSSGSASFPPLYSFSPASHSAFTLAPHSRHVACSCTLMTSWPLALQERRWQAASSPVPSLHRPLGVTSSSVAALLPSWSWASRQASRGHQEEMAAATGSLWGMQSRPVRTAAAAPKPPISDVKYMHICAYIYPTGVIYHFRVSFLLKDIDLCVQQNLVVAK